MTNTPPDGIAFALVLNGEQKGNGFLPLPDSYVKAEQELQNLIVSIRDALARHYDARGQQMATIERERSQTLAAEVARLTAELAKHESTPEDTS